MGVENPNREDRIRGVIYKDEFEDFITRDWKTYHGEDSWVTRDMYRQSVMNERGLIEFENRMVYVGAENRYLLRSRQCEGLQWVLEDDRLVTLTLPENEKDPLQARRSARGGQTSSDGQVTDPDYIEEKQAELLEEDRQFMMHEMEAELRDARIRAGEIAPMDNHGPNLTRQEREEELYGAGSTPDEDRPLRPFERIYNDDEHPYIPPDYGRGNN